jgi:hypothetical protein
MTAAVGRSPFIIPFSINATKVRISERRTKQKNDFFVFFLPNGSNFDEVKGMANGMKCSSKSLCGSQYRHT